MPHPRGAGGGHAGAFPRSSLRAFCYVTRRTRLRILTDVYPRFTPLAPPSPSLLQRRPSSQHAQHAPTRRLPGGTRDARTYEVRNRNIKTAPGGGGRARGVAPRP